MIHSSGRLARWWVVALVIGQSLSWVGAEESRSLRQPFRYDSKGRRDPFLALVRDGRVVGMVQGVEGGGARPVLYGILWDPGGASMALINDVEARVGDTVSGYRVKDIRQDAVVLESGGEPLVLQIMFGAPPAASSDTRTGGEEP